MPAKIQTLIEKLDSYEVVRDKIYTILVEEIASQQVLALAALPTPKDPANWALRVFRERSNPIDDWIHKKEPINKTPICNIWFNETNYPEGAGNAALEQQGDGSYMIDVYAYAEATATAEGHDPGDRTAALLAQNRAKLVRNILMNPVYSHLGLEGLVRRRWPTSIRSLQVGEDNQAVENVHAMTFALNVTAQEFTDENLPGDLAIIFHTILNDDVEEPETLAELEIT